MASPLSPYQLRAMADNLRAFPVDSALRQVALHVSSDDVTADDAEQLRAIVTNRRLWLY